MYAVKPCRNCGGASAVAVPSGVAAAPTAVGQTSACPECGSLECLCRPRFFDGQLLSAEDLTRLERYIVKKNRLHNRYLHGWGVVAGLEAVCHPCKDQVIVRKGYALSPCGDDIVVCGDVVVQVCDLIRSCRRVAADECVAADSGDGKGCAEATEDWILSICYEEKPTRGITALRGGGTAARGCADLGTTAGASSSSSRYYPAQCEPSLVRESCRFEVRKAPVQVRDAKRTYAGAMQERFTECYRELMSVFPDPPFGSGDAIQLANTRPSRAELQNYCCELRDALREFFLTHSTYNCLLDERLAKIRCPDESLKEEEFSAVFTEAYRNEILIAMEYLRYCMCSIFLPPVEDGVSDACVPLAVVTINRRNCHIIDVCNVSARRFAVTTQNLGYWLSWLPLGDLFRTVLEKLCCVPLLTPSGSILHEGRTVVKEKAGPAAAEAKPSGEKPYTAAKMSRDLVAIFASAWTRTKGRVGLDTVIMDGFGIAGADGNPLLSDAERRNPLATLLANEMALPLMESFLPWGGGADIEDLKVQVVELRNTVDRQQETIDRLSRNNP